QSPLLSSFTAPAPPELYSLSLHDALPISRGLSPSCLAFSSLMISTAEAPSEICDELPAVTLPSSLKAGLRLASVSAVVPGRMPSDRKSTRLNSSHVKISYAVFCLKKKKHY